MGINDLMDSKGSVLQRLLPDAALEIGKEEMNRSTAKEKSQQPGCFRDFSKRDGRPAVWILLDHLLNKANKVIRKCNISEGGVSGTVVDPKKIFKIALDQHASSIILVTIILPGISNPAKPIRRSQKRSGMRIYAGLACWTTSSSATTSTIALRMKEPIVQCRNLESECRNVIRKILPSETLIMKVDEWKRLNAGKHW